MRRTPQRFDASGPANVRCMRHSPGFEGYFDAEEDSKKRTKEEEEEEDEEAGDECINGEYRPNKRCCR